MFIMVRYYRIERIQGLEILVCEVFDRYLWTNREIEAFEACRVANLPDKVSRELFREMLDEWCHEDVHEKDSFFGLNSPIPVLEWIPSLVIRSAIVSNRPAQLQVDFKSSVTDIFIRDEIGRFFDFVKSPHWRNAVNRQLVQYGSLFEPDNC